ncbi:hypothetical protein [Fodinicola acaciae]|uniref:hypothetical protein n=1 Tax=Fodinicola acaciae TaxID=2681555 RepID=UPI0013D203AC|nr:hypothetical protein [Fodinicola acaciae]
MIRVIRLVACYGTITAGIPYVVLKVIWVLGIPVGMTGASHVAELLDRAHVVGNVVTIGLEVVAIALALAFTYAWGRSIPGPLVLVPIWVGTGLLAPIVLGVPTGVLLQLVVGGSPSPDPQAAGWIFAMVYGGFTAQAIFLCAAFVLYARERWGHVFERADGRADQIQVMLANGAAIPAAAYGVIHLVWTFAGDRLAGPAGFETAAQRTALFVTGVVVIGGAVGVMALVRQRRTTATLTLAWVGAATTFASGLHGINSGGVTGLIFEAGMLAGLLLGVAGLLNLAQPCLVDKRHYVK